VTLKLPSSRARWQQLGAQLLENGYAVVRGLCPATETKVLTSMWGRAELFRKHVVMKQHAFGEGEYAYFAEPLPEPIATLRTSLYAGLVPTANTMMERLETDIRYPATLAEYRLICRAGNQTKPTPLLLRYERGGYNRLHRDLYGELVFPLQATILLSRPGADFEGGQFLLVENSPRMQARGEVIDLKRGDAVIFPTADVAVPGARGWRRAQLRHGVATIQKGIRLAAGIIFHDAA
jgi:hypothetical protein